MAEPFLGEIRMLSFAFPPRGWALCNGQLLPINTNQALFSLLGTSFGGDGRTTFALPNLQGRAPVHAENGAIVIGQSEGSETVSLAPNQAPGHAHTVYGSANQATSTNPAATVLAQKGRGGVNVYGGAPNTTLAAGTLSEAAGGGQPHSNMQPYVAVQFAIATVGIFPSRN